LEEAVRPDGLKLKVLSAVERFKTALGWGGSLAVVFLMTLR
jgi:hypothetical protein